MAKVTVTMFGWQDRNKVKLHVTWATEFDNVITTVNVRLRSLRSYLQALTSPSNQVSVFLYDMPERHDWPAEEVGFRVTTIPTAELRPDFEEWSLAPRPGLEPGAEIMPIPGAHVINS